MYWNKNHFLMNLPILGKVLSEDEMLWLNFLCENCFSPNIQNDITFLKSVQHKLSNEWSHDMVWDGIQKSKIGQRVHLHQYMGLGAGTLAKCANPIILPDLGFTLEMPTFEVVTQHIVWIFIFNMPPILMDLLIIWHN